MCWGFEGPAFGQRHLANIFRIGGAVARFALQHLALLAALPPLSNPQSLSALKTPRLVSTRGFLSRDAIGEWCGRTNH